jgi:WD40 repeat protein
MNLQSYVRIQAWRVLLLTLLTSCLYISPVTAREWETAELWSIPFNIGIYGNFSSDEKSLALSYPFRFTSVRQTESGDILYHLEPPLFEHNPLTPNFSPDGSYISAHINIRNAGAVPHLNEDKITLHHAIDGKYIKTFYGFETMYDDPAIKFSPDSGLVAAAGGRCDPCRSAGRAFGTLALWRVSDGERLWYRVEQMPGLWKQIAFSPDGKTLVSLGQVSPGFRVQFWNVANGAPKHKLDGGQNAFGGLSYSPDGQLLAVGVGSSYPPQSDWHVLLLRSSDGKQTGRIGQGMDHIQDLQFSPDGSVLATYGYEGIRFWRMRDGVLLYHIPIEPPYLRPWIATISPRWGKIAHYRIKKEQGQIAPVRQLIVRKNPVSQPLRVGDLDSNGEVDVGDVALSLRLAVRLITPSEEQKSVGDVYEDGQFTVVDSVMLLRNILGMGSLNTGPSSS